MSEIMLGGRAFASMGDLRLERDANGSINRYRPQLPGKTLHKYGNGQFCKFTLPSACNDAGVYVMRVSEVIMYCGQTIDLHKRFYDYGHISARNCYPGGRQTNC